MKLIDIYEGSIECDMLAILYRLLDERTDVTNISHRRMPSWSEHKAFVASGPYRAWYLIVTDADIPVGSIYLTKENEIGVFVAGDSQRKGYGTWAISALMKRHGARRYLANINPRNEQSIRLFASFGFQLIQHTYAMETKK
jgi:RimJ/RimL family protein N-acetyltransferase